MKRSVSAVAAVGAMVLWASAASAQTQFAGKWAPDMEKTMAANPQMAAGGGGGGGGGRGGFGGAAMSIAIADDAMTVTRTTQNGDQATTYTLNDKEQTITGPRGDSKVKAKWESSKTKIVMETKRTGQDGTEQVSKSIYSVEGDYLVIERTQNGRDGTPMTIKTYYKKAA